MNYETVKRRDWVFTHNNYTEESLAAVKAIECKYLVFGKEVASTGTPHLQGFIYFQNPRVFSGVRNLFPQGTHIEPSIAVEKAIAYCKKGEQPKAEWELDGVKGNNYGLNADVFEKGIAPLTNKQKGDLEVERYEDAKRLAMEGQLEDIPGDIFIRCYKSLTAIKKDYMVKPADLDGVCGVWIYGKSGVGKSRMARALWPGLFDKLINKWWDGYQGEPHVLLDDFDPTHSVLFHYLKRWADRYSFTCENKGGGMCIRPKTIIITSQYKPEEIWTDQQTLDAIYRRYKLIELNEPYVEGFVPFELFGQHVAFAPQQYAEGFVPVPQVGDKRRLDMPMTMEEFDLDVDDLDDLLSL